jgi:hypothetical protein
LTILRLSPKQSGRALAEKDISSSTDPYGRGRSETRISDSLLRELEVTSPWQVHVQRVDALLRSPDPVSDVEGILDRLLFLDDVASTAVRVLEEANGEGIAGYSSVTGQTAGGLPRRREAGDRRGMDDRRRHGGRR